MKLSGETSAILSALMMTQGLFFCLVLWRLKNGQRQANRILALLFLGIALRMGKTLVFYLGGKSMLFYFNLTIGLFLAIGPLFYLYTCFFLLPNFRWQPKYLIHFIPTAIFILLSPFIVPNNQVLWWQITYIGVLAQMAVYQGWTGKQLLHSLPRLSHLTKRWLLGLWVGLWVILGTFIAHFMIAFPVPFIGITLYLVLMYGMGYLGLTQSKLFAPIPTKAKYYSSSLTPEKARHYAGLLRQLFAQEKLYLNADLTLPKLAKKLHITPQTLSQVINEQFGQTYSDFVGQHRIDAAKKALLAPENQHKKIAGIAFEAGFNTLSAFNVLFKKQTGTTPSQYRKDNS